MIGAAIFFGFLYGILGFCFLLPIKQSPRKRFLIAISGILFFAVLLLVLAACINSARLSFFGALVPFHIVLSFISVDSFVRYKKCTVALEARCVSYSVRSKRGIKRLTPRFSYCYNGQEAENDSFVSYRPAAFKELFLVGGRCTVYIDPLTPQSCVDKRRFPLTPQIITLVYSLLFSVIFTYISFSPNAVFA